FDRVVFFFNALCAALLLFSYTLPHAFPERFPMLSVLGLTLPVFMILNLAFLIYWLARLRRQGLLSLLVLLIGYSHIASFYKFSGNDTIEKVPGSVSVMTYNVRLFNAYRWIDDDSVAENIVALINNASPDILCIQEFHLDKAPAFSRYPYQYIASKNPGQKNGQAVFSRFPIVNKGSLEFPHTGNNAIYVDVVKGKDTVRVYNLHLESLRIHPEREELTREGPERLYKRLSTAFSAQQQQVAIVAAHKEKCRYKKIICGDFNNTPYSNVYRRLKKDMNDTFKEAGRGFGRTFNFSYFPIRIDF
ncbi:MAG: endonuclease/exonuclease/phosphatase family protein, partial [Sinomicrobium sp.]|nr:endonuclease/exonuclease/phosphatase family protein [Sinomicrobium sp.]